MRRRFFLFTGGNQEVSRSVTHVIFDSSIQNIEERTFYACPALVTVELNIGLQLIGYGSFCNCHYLRTIIIPATVKEIGDRAFLGCRSLETMKLPLSITGIGTNLFRGCLNLISVHLPKGLKLIPEGTFYACESLKSLVIPSTVKEIGESACAGCKNLVSVELSEGLQKIGLYSFDSCKSLTNITIPFTVRFVNEHSFEDCDKLRKRFANGTLIEGLRSRFVDLPLHSLCYHQTHYSEQTVLEKLARSLQSDEVATLEKTDAFGMTPLHIMALSANPHWRIFVELLQFYSLRELYKKDKWGETAIYYLCLTDSKALINTLIRTTVIDRIKWLGLEKWKKEISTRIDSLFQSKVASERVQEITEIYIKLALYERMEATSLLEQALWKLKIDEAKSLNKNSEESREENSAKRIKIDDTMDRQRYRGSCSADINSIMSNVSSFLGKLGQE